MPAMVVLARTTAKPETMATALRATVHEIDRDQPVYNLKTMNEIVAASTAQQRFQAVLSSLFAVAALLLVAGIRIAVGASTHNIVRMVIAQGMRNVLIGLAAGLLGSLALTRLIGSSVFRLTTAATDLRIYLGVALLLVVVALLACYRPAWRATKIDPAQALRSE